MYEHISCERVDSMVHSSEQWKENVAGAWEECGDSVKSWGPGVSVKLEFTGPSAQPLAI